MRISKQKVIIEVKCSIRNNRDEDFQDSRRFILNNISYSTLEQCVREIYGIKLGYNITTSYTNTSTSTTTTPTTPTFTTPTPNTTFSTPPGISTDKIEPDFTIEYKDDDNDLVLITSDEDLVYSLKLCQNNTNDFKSATQSLSGYLSLRLYITLSEKYVNYNINNNGHDDDDDDDDGNDNGGGSGNNDGDDNDKGSDSSDSPPTTTTNTDNMEQKLTKEMKREIEVKVLKYKEKLIRKALKRLQKKEKMFKTDKQKIHKENRSREDDESQSPPKDVDNVSNEIAPHDDSGHVSGDKGTNRKHPTGKKYKSYSRKNAADGMDGEKGDGMDKKEQKSRKFMARFVEHVTVPDGTEFKPNTAFKKIWRFRNESKADWPLGCKIVNIGKKSSQIIGPKEVEIGTDVKPGDEIDVQVPLMSPSAVGNYHGYWRMCEKDGRKFGQRVWVQINVIP